jgi:hypothetical protein
MSLKQDQNRQVPYIEGSGEHVLDVDIIWEIAAASAQRFRYDFKICTWNHCIYIYSSQTVTYVLYVRDRQEHILIIVQEEDDDEHGTAGFLLSTNVFGQSKRSSLSYPFMQKQYRNIQTQTNVVGILLSFKRTPLSCDKAFFMSKDTLSLSKTIWMSPNSYSSKKKPMTDAISIIATSTPRWHEWGWTDQTPTVQTYILHHL